MAGFRLRFDAQLRARPSDPLLLRIVGTLLQVEQHYRGPGHRGVSAAREQTMADNIRWLAETLHAGGPIMIWAHNGHVSRQPLHPTHSDAMGRHLAEHFQEGFVNLGFVFARGAFLARDRRDQDRPIRELTLPSVPASLGSYLAGGGLLFALDLRALPEGSSLRQWLTEPRQGWVVGSVVGDPRKQTGEFELLSCFDLIVFIENVTAATLVEPARAEPARPAGQRE